MATKPKAAPERILTDAELEQVARALVSHAEGLSGGDFKKELAPEFKKSDKKILEAATRLAARRELHRWSVAKKVRFFLQDPFDGLAGAVARQLEGGPVTEPALKTSVEAAHRGYGDLLKEWLKAAVARGELYVHPPRPGTSAKRYGLSPDLKSLLKKVHAELAKVLASSVGQRVPKAELLRYVAAELGIASDPARPPPQAPADAGKRERFLVQLGLLALADRRGGLLPVRELRERLALEKPVFDQLALALMRDELVTLHQHDFPTALSEAERADYVVDSRGNYFGGIALRSPS